VLNFLKEQVMRKLLVLLTVLAIASIASAGEIDPLIVSLNGQPIDPTDEIWIIPSDEIDFDIVAIDHTVLTIDVIVTVTGMGALLTDATSLAAITYVDDDPGYRAEPLVITPWVSYELGTANFSGMSGTIFDHLLMHCEGQPGDVIISASAGTTFGGTLDGDGNPYTGGWSSVTVHQIPEPMTVALLGLGGLFLLRRRR
jgi:hypothetical protein